MIIIALETTLLKRITMNRFILSLLLLATPVLSQAQMRIQPQRAVNRYGQPIINRGGEWMAANPGALADINNRLDTIPGYNEPYTYKPEKIQPDEMNNCRTEIYTYKSYPDYDLQLGVDMPKNNTSGPTPVLFVIHGGGWRSGSFDAANFVRQGCFFASHGITVVRVEYTLAGKGTIENSIADLQDAIRYVTERAAQFNIDPTRIGFTGSSAGGHLSSYMAMTWPGTKVLVSHCGPQDLDRMFGDRMRHTPINDIEKLKEQLQYFLVTEGNTDKLKEYSPVNNIPETNKIPAVMLMHGNFDLTVPFDQTIQFADSLKAHGIKTLEVRVAEYGSHGYFNPNRAGYEDDMLAVLEFLHKNL